VQLPLTPSTSSAYSITTPNSKSSIITNSPTNMADYTLLVYMMGSDLEAKYGSATDDINEMKNARKNSNINVIIQTGGGGAKIDESSEDRTFVNFSKVQRHKIVNGNIDTMMDLGHRNMAERSTLSDFINWGISEFPAKKYAIILWDHGSGLNGFGKDLNFDNDMLTPVDLAKAFISAKNQTGVNFELIGFDACLMSSLEIASRLHSFGQYMVSSQEVEPRWGWDYTAIINTLTSNPDQSGRSLGIAIVDSFVVHSKNNSVTENFGTDKGITLSLIDLIKIPQLVKDLNTLSKALDSNIYDVSSAINLSKSVDLTEHYGQSSGGSSGLIDLYDLTVNIQDKYPSLLENIKQVQNSLKAASIYAFNGTSRPNANGLSVYMPMLKNEFSDRAEFFVVDPNWWRLVKLHRTLINSDILRPVIKSIIKEDIVKTHVYGSDISNIFAEIITNSSRGHDLRYIQNIEPSIMDKQGFFDFKEHKMLVICNETKCIPATMSLEVNRDKKFAFIPVRLESSEENINENMSLVYEIGKGNKFLFLGATQEVNPEETIPKGAFGLNKNDKIFTKALPSKAEYQDVGDINNPRLRNISTYTEEDGPLTVNYPTKIEPHYINITSPFTISFTICDYSDNCDKTRWYSINSTDQILPILPSDVESSTDVLNENGTESTKSTGDFLTYINPTFGFKLRYPAYWDSEIQNIYDFSDVDLTDPVVVALFPSNYNETIGSNYRPVISISVTDWPFKESPKSLFDFFNNTIQNPVKQNYKILQSGPTVIAGNDAFKYIVEYVSEEEKFLGLPEEKRTEEITTILMNGKMYSIFFGSYSSQFDYYLPEVENIINSFAAYPNQNQYQYQNQSHTSVPLDNGTSKKSMSNVNGTSKINNLLEGDNSTMHNQSVIEDIIFSTHNDKKYGYTINFPSNVGIGRPFSMEGINPNVTGNLFFLDNSSQKTSDPGEAVQVILSAFNKNETERMKKFFAGVKYSLLPDPDNFNIDGIISAVREQLSLYKISLPNFTLLENSTTNFKGNPAYTIEYKYFNPAFRSQQHTKLIFIVYDDRLFALEYSSNPTKYHQYLAIFQKMINSLELENRQ